MSTNAEPIPLSKARREKQVRRVSVSVPEVLYCDLEMWAEERNDSLSGVFRWSLGVAKVIWDQMQAGNHIYVEGKDGTKRELVFNPFV